MSLTLIQLIAPGYLDVVVLLWYTEVLDTEVLDTEVLDTAVLDTDLEYCNHTHGILYHL